MVSIENLVGRKLDFYGAHDRKFKLGREDGSTFVLQAVEDPLDGTVYRSCLKGLRQVEEQQGLFSHKPVARVSLLEWDGKNTLIAKEDGSVVFDGIFGPESVDLFVGYLLVNISDSRVLVAAGTIWDSIYGFCPSFVFESLNLGC